MLWHIRMSILISWTCPGGTHDSGSFSVTSRSPRFLASILAALSVRQREILGYVVEGLSNAEIGRRLYLSESTIKQHLRAVYKLLGVSNSTEAANLLRRGN
jgi:DNA-binding NarL/FixJ family response regulator